MKPNQLKTTSILLAVLLVLVGAGWWLWTTQDMAVNQKLVFKFPVEQITRFEITRTDSRENPELVKLELQGQNKWRMTAPLKDDTNPSTMNSIVELFRKLEVEETIQDVKSLTEYGLDKPTTRVKVFSKRKKLFEFLIGAETPLSYEFYAKFADKPQVYVVAGVVRTTFNYDLKELEQAK
jgi:hypothetical protein